jgi:hypothetical protein
MMPGKIRIIFLLSFLLLSITGARGGSWYYDEILVEYKQAFSQQDISAFTAKYGQAPLSPGRAAAVLERAYDLSVTRTYLKNVPFTVYRVPDITKLPDLVQAIRGESVVKRAQPNFKRKISYTPVAGGPNDPFYASPAAAQWGFNKIHADDAFAAGMIDPSTNRTVIIAVMDSGILSTHEDLAGVTTAGSNILAPASPPNDDDGHGTIVAGICGANTGNGIGIAGAAYRNATWTAKVLIMPVKVMAYNGEGSDGDVYSGVLWAVDNGANVINCSFGGPDQSDYLQDAMNYAYNHGCVSVAAAGNDNTGTYYPAACSDVISVSATDASDNRADFGGGQMPNYGKIDVSAPGVQILSCSNTATNNVYDYESGTSMSAPFVSGLAAMIMLKYPALNNDAVIKIIEQTCDDAGAPGYDIYTGWGRINFVKALSMSYNTPKQVNTYNWPNPFSPDRDQFTSITFTLNAPADASVVIYDAGGDIVWKKSSPASAQATGYNFIKWDGKNTSGKAVANGTYFYVLKINGVDGKNKIVVLH